MWGWILTAWSDVKTCGKSYWKSVWIVSEYISGILVPRSWKRKSYKHIYQNIPVYKPITSLETLGSTLWSSPTLHDWGVLSPWPSWNQLQSTIKISHRSRCSLRRGPLAIERQSILRGEMDGWWNKITKYWVLFIMVYLGFIFLIRSPTAELQNDETTRWSTTTATTIRHNHKHQQWPWRRAQTQPRDTYQPRLKYVNNMNQHNKTHVISLLIN